METASKVTKSQLAGSKMGVRPPSSKYASLFGRRQLMSGMTKSEKSTIISKQNQIFNEQNVDVTPLPLLDSVQLKRNNVTAPTLEGTVAEFPSIIGMTVASSFGGGPFTRSVFNTTAQYDGSEDYSDQDMSSVWRVSDTQSEAVEILNEKDLETFVTIYLEESDTDIVFELFSTCVMAGTSEEEAVSKRNKQYKILVNSRDGNDRYVSKEMNTFNNQLKLKHIQTNPITYQNTGIMASNWDMYDSYRGIQTQEVSASVFNEVADEDFLEKPSDMKMFTGNQEADSGKEKKKSTSDDTMYSSVTSSLTSQNQVVILNDKSNDEQMKNTEKILQNERFKNDLFMIERIINLNTYQIKLAEYRNLPISWVGEKDAWGLATSQVKDAALSAPNLHKLWSFVCPLTKGRTVSCMAWNPNNPDLIAVGYGQLEFKSQKSGLSCCWSLKNPEYPERVFPSEHGVTAVNFSSFNSNLLAVGFYNGGLAVYDMSNNSNQPLLHNLISPFKHTGPVGQVRWIEKETSSEVSEKIEILVSISKDGRVTSWSIRKGFESNDLMRLRRVGLSAKVAGKSREKKVEMFISRYDGGMCLDFNPIATNIYLVGTEEAYIHKCSCSYNEQYLDTYIGHLAPVYCVVWSPFLPDVFLSCGADWTVRLWHQDRLTPILTFFFIHCFRFQIRSLQVPKISSSCKDRRKNSLSFEKCFFN